MVGTGDSNGMSDLLGGDVSFLQSLLTCLNSEVDPGLSEELIKFPD
jgi:hypothetical protein